MDMTIRDMSAFADVQLATSRDPRPGDVPTRIASTAVPAMAFTPSFSTPVGKFYGKQGTAVPFGAAAALRPGIRSRGGPD